MSRSEAKRSLASATESDTHVSETSCTTLHSHVGTKRSTGVKEALLVMARRIVAYPAGNFAPSAPPRVLETITDANLDVAFEVAATVGAEATPKLSGSAEQRLLAWLVADARGATVVLDPPSAERVGKRLKKQALKVRADVADVPQWAEDERARVRAAANASPALRPQLRADLAAIDAAEQRKLQAPQEEIYVGFHELDQLELRATPADGGPDGSLRAPWALEPEPPSIPIPPDLAALLGDDGCRAALASRESLGPILCAEDWWTLGLPHTVGDLMMKLRSAEGRVAELEDRTRRGLQSLTSIQQEVTAALFELGAREELERENTRLRAEVQVAQGTEEALHEVIRRLSSGSRVLSWPGGRVQGSGAE